MQPLVVEQALFLKFPDELPRLQGRSPGFDEEALADARRAIADFGERPPRVTCPGALFVQVFRGERTAVANVADLAEGEGLGFRFLLFPTRDYRHRVADPFAVQDAFPPGDFSKGDLAPLEWNRSHPPARTVAEVQGVLRQVKAHALKEDEDPLDEEFIHTVENALSPALLGGVQVLVDGGRLVVERPAPDEGFVRGLWTLLPNRLRGTLRLATFAFSDRLDCHVLVVPSTDLVDMADATTEDMAAEYPQGSYELALQTAAEAGDQAALDRVLERRTSRETMKLGLGLMIFLTLLVLISRWGIGPAPEDPSVRPPADAERPLKAATAAAIVGVQDPWTALELLKQGDARWPRK